MFRMLFSICCSIFVLNFAKTASFLALFGSEIFFPLARPTGLDLVRPCKPTFLLPWPPSEKMFEKVE